MSHINISLFFTVFNLILLEIKSFSSVNFNVNDFDKKSKLTFVHVLFRHGDRNPLGQNPGDPYDVSYWPGGWGQLTPVGSRQHYALGKWLRQRYRNFLNATYNPTDIYVQSTDIDRTLMSAQSNLAGLYPPKKNQIWNPSLLWQPIPVHTIPYDTDYLIAGDVPPSCSGFYSEVEKYNQSPEILRREAKAKPYFELLTNKMGTTVNNLANLTAIRDSWLCEIAHNLRIPKWAEHLLQNDKEFYKASLVSYQALSETPLLAKLGSGFLLKDILDRFTSKVEKTLVPDRKFWIYSSHDVTVIGLLNSMGVFDNKFPDYTATIILELRFYRNDYYVQLIYKNFEEKPKVLNIPGCGVACPLSKIREIYANILPKNAYVVECQINENNN